MDQDDPLPLPDRMAAAPDVSFLGACHSVNVNTRVPATNVDPFGLSHVVQSFVYPLPVGGMMLVFAAYAAERLSPSVVRVVNPRGEMMVRVDIKPPEVSREVLDDPYFNRGSSLLWTRVPDAVLVPEPGVYSVLLGEGASARRIGELIFAYVEVPPFTNEQIEAIRLNPRALLGVQLTFACSKCADKISIYTAFERVPEQEKAGAIWQHDLPPVFACSCRGTRFDLSILKKNLHAYLGGEAGGLPMGMRDVGALHRQAALMAICTEFFALLEREAPEEDVHQFINANRVLLHVFAPVRVHNKPPITARYRADFAILTSSRELLLIELERPATSLLKKNGGMTAELQKPFDQVRNWLAAVADHRSAVLDDMSLPKEAVTAVRAVVIAGRTVRENPAHLRTLSLGLSKDDVRFMTYDDLLVAMIVLVQSLAKTEPGMSIPWSSAKDNPSG